ncbi:hypothetical protein PR048_016839 [Dryococelus australis]|uniref:Uncharacterized protein n=1 Tax=Dryococelus australis TaxID=614101 RepID=A0ABQ9H7V6_9NEOP|nr:hypothetical protein PR048_016839 [Dryococelus australis]
MLNHQPKNLVSMSNPVCIRGNNENTDEVLVNLYYLKSHVKWIPGKVVRKTGNVVYLVKLN